MHVGFTRVTTADQPLANATIVAEEMMDWLRQIEGFEGLLFLSREGTTIGLTFWESGEALGRNRSLRRQFIERMSSVVDVQVEEMLEFELTFGHLGSVRTAAPE